MNLLSMHTTEAFPESYGQLEKLVQTAVEGADCVVMQTGHFLLQSLPGRDRPLACLPDELTDPEHAAIRAAYASFPILTWQLGLKLLASLPTPRREVMIMVNDWQYVASAGAREQFYSSYPSLPPSYQRALQSAGTAVNLLRPAATNGKPSGPFFSESTVRNHFRKSVKRLLKAGPLSQDITVTHGEEVTCEIMDQTGQAREIYCSSKSTDCAGETAQFLHEAATITGCTAFINIVPRVCLDFVNFGTELGEKLFSPGIRSYVNIGMPSSNVRDEETLIKECRCRLLRT